MPFAAIASAFGLYFLAGAVQAMYGPSIPALSLAYGRDAGAIGILLTAHFTSALLGMFLAAVSGRHLSAGSQLRIAALAQGAGCAMMTAGGAWPSPIVAASVIGLGYGGLVLGLLTLFGTGFGARSPAMLSLLNGGFGVGALLAPLVVGFSPATRPGWPFLFVGVPTLLLAMPIGRARYVGGESERRTRLRDYPWGRIAGFVGVFLLYAGGEGSIGGWEPTHLMAVGRSATAAVSLTALFWAAISVGRFLVAPLSLRIAPERIVVCSLAGAAVVLQAAHWSPAAPAAYAAAGLLLAPVFPCGLAWLIRDVPGARGMTAPVLIGAFVGGAIFPATIGSMLSATSPRALPAAAGVVIASAFVIACAMKWRASRETTLKAL